MAQFPHIKTKTFQQPLKYFRADCCLHSQKTPIFQELSFMNKTMSLPNPKVQLIIVLSGIFILSFCETLIAFSIKSPSYIFVLRKHKLHELERSEENCIRRAILTIILFLDKTQNQKHCFHIFCQPCIMFFFRDDTSLDQCFPVPGLCISHCCQ